jgi:peptidyl-prolyl cis-trans isomerase B (cyclophilin B)
MTKILFTTNLISIKIMIIHGLQQEQSQSNLPHCDIRSPIQYKTERRYFTMAQNPIVTFTMENGDIFKAELYPDIAPTSVNNFISLIQKNFYDGLIFHRVIKGFMIQGGDPEGTGMGGPGYSIRGEFSQNGFKNDLRHTAGVLSMARSMHPDSAGSQFFIMHKDSPHLDGAYAAFGKVIEGLENVNKIAETPTDYSDRPLENQVIKSVTVDTFGIEYPEPDKIM